MYYLIIGNAIIDITDLDQETLKEEDTGEVFSLSNCIHELVSIIITIL